MTYAVVNSSGASVSVGGLTWGRGETKNLNIVNQDIIDAVEVKHTLNCSTDLTPLVGLADIVSTMNTLAAGGTAATPVSGTRTIATVTDIPTTVAAVAGLAAEINAARTVIASLIGRVEVLENVLVTHESNIVRSSIAS